MKNDFVFGAVVHFFALSGRSLTAVDFDAAAVVKCSAD